MVGLYHKGIFFVFILIFLVVLTFELKALSLLGRCYATSTTPTTLFAVGIFQVGSHAYAQAILDYNPPIYTSHVGGMSGACHLDQFFLPVDMGLTHFFACAGLKL
jgi:hypothetical protein